MRKTIVLSFLILFTSYVYALGDGVEFDKEVYVKGTTEKDTVHGEKDMIHGEKDMVHVPVLITSNGNIYDGAFRGQLILSNDGKPLALITNNGKPLVTNNGKPLVWNEGKPFVLFTNEGKPLIWNEGKPIISFDNQGQPLIVVKVDMGPLGKTIDNSIHTIVIVLVFVILVICGCGIWYVIKSKNHEVAREIEHAQEIEKEFRSFKRSKGFES